MNLRMMHEQLVQKIQQFSNDSREHRQVYKRLTQLLPDRFKRMVATYKAKGLGGSECARAVLVSDELIAHLQEISAVGASSMEARIQYETHLMLIDARQSINKAARSFK